jgi:hypothetical protein
MKKTDLVNELAKFTVTKKEAVMAVEIMLNLIKDFEETGGGFSFWFWNFQYC